MEAFTERDAEWLNYSFVSDWCPFGDGPPFDTVFTVVGGQGYFQNALDRSLLPVAIPCQVS